MRQIFFISPNGYPAVREAFSSVVEGARTRGWCDDGDDPKNQTVIGVVEMDGHCDAEKVIECLESQGILWLPNHHKGEPIKHEYVDHLARHGVTHGDTTENAMAKIHAKSGFPPLKPKRF